MTDLLKCFGFVLIGYLYMVAFWFAFAPISEL